LYNAQHIPMNSLRNTNLLYALSFALVVALVGGVMLKNNNSSVPASAGITAPEADTTYKLSILFAGDVMMHSPQLDAAFNATDGQYYFDNNFRFVKPLISNYDLAIANLETTLPGEGFSGYPQFGSPDNLAKSLAWAGFDVLANANNHAADKGDKGIQRTIDIVEHEGMQHTGSYKDTINRENENPLIIIRNNIKIAILNYTYGTNGIKVKKPYIINPIDTALIHADLKKAKYYQPDYTIVFFHWGNEYQRNPDATQRSVAEFTFENGADLIIGAHPHVIQPIEEITYRRGGKKHTGVVFWSLGNYISNQRNQYQDGGIMAHLELTKNTKKGETTLSNYAYIPAWVNKASRTMQKDYFILPVSMYQADTTIFEINKAENYKFKLFANDTRTHLKDVKELKYPITWRTDTAAFNRIKPYYEVQLMFTADDKDPAGLLSEYGMNKDTLARLCDCVPAFSKQKINTTQYRYYFNELPKIENARKIARKLREYGVDKALIQVVYK
jgi:poly-gamma-glutamate capsule biosynthesis protein CapA/YwtB (metallophosphatase superfamily)